jgi:hypothetical protein
MIDVRDARTSDLPFIDALQLKHGRELGFLTREALEAYVLAKVVVLASLNDEPCGYVLGRSNSQSELHGAHIVQACVQYDARHFDAGCAMVERFASRLNDNCRYIRLWCASDLEANFFWEFNGFEAQAWREGSKKTGRFHFLWKKRLCSEEVPDGFNVPSSSLPGSFRERRAVIGFSAGETWKDFQTRTPSLVISSGSATPSGCLQNAVKRVQKRALSYGHPSKSIRANRNQTFNPDTHLRIQIGGRLLVRPRSDFVQCR